MIETILGIIVIVCFILLIIVIYNNKYKFAIIKIDKAEEDISLYLDKKKELINRTRPIISKELKLDEFLSDIEDINDETSNFLEYDILKKCYNELFKVLDENEKLMKSESIVSILDELDDNEEDIIGAIKFYNDTVVDFNKLQSSFPSNIIGFFKRYKKKEFYNDEKRETFSILEDKDV